MQTVETTLVNVPIRPHNVGFTVVSAIIDNNTSQYAYVPAAGAFVQPGATRYALSIAPSWSELEVLWPGPPRGQVVGPVQSPTEQLTVTWSSDPAIGSGAPGNVYTPATPQTLLASGSYPTLVPATVFAKLPLPNGIHALALAVNPGPTGAVPFVKVTGDQSGIVYVDTRLSATLVGPMYQAGLVLSALDSTVTVTKTGGAPGGTMSLVGIYDTASVDITGPQGGRVPVTTPAPTVSAATSWGSQAVGTYAHIFAFATNLAIDAIFVDVATQGVAGMQSILVITDDFGVLDLQVSAYGLGMKWLPLYGMVLAAGGINLQVVNAATGVNTFGYVAHTL